MNLHLSRKVYTNFNILCIIVFSGQLCFAKTKDQKSIAFNTKKTENFEALKDTSSLFYYSFEQRRVINFNELLSDAHLAIVEACDGSDLVLSAPDYGDDARYFWSGPNGYKANTMIVNLTKLQTKNDGIYSIRVIKNDVEVLGKIKLVINESPIYTLGKVAFEEGETIHIQLVNDTIGNVYAWENPEGKIVSKSKDLWLSSHKVGKYPYRLIAKRNGCKEATDFLLSITERPKPAVSLSLYEIIQNGE